jgi:2-methylcitrate dehydratase PrpD
VTSSGDERLAADNGATRRIAEFAVSTSLGDVPPAALAAARLSILDTVGCGLAALGQDTARSLLDHVESLGGTPTATIIGGARPRTSAPLAAMANGAMMNLLDFDGLWHIPTYVLPAVHATAELAAADGNSALEAFVVGAEVASRLRQAIDGLRDQHGGPTYRGWYHVSIYGPIAAAVAASKVLGLDVLETRAAIGIAVNGSGGVRQNLGTTAKSLLSGNAASHGVHAALLARAGIWGARDIVEARLGLINALCLPGECDWDPVLNALGRDYVLAEGPDIKRYPSVGPTQAVIATLQRLRADHPFAPAEVVSVEARLSEFSAHSDYPDDPMMAGFRWPYVLAATLVDGSFTVDHLTARSIGNPAIRRCADSISFVRASDGDDGSVAITLDDGRVLTATVDLALSVEHSEAAVREKAQNCMRMYLDDASARALEELVMTLESQPTVAILGDNGP